MADNATSTEGGKKQGSLVMTLAVVAGLSCIAAGGGWMLGMTLGPQDADGKPAMEEAGSSGHGGEGEDDGGIQAIDTEENGIVALAPLTTNLAYPDNSWIKLEVALMFRDHPDVDTAEDIHQDLMAYLKTVSLQQIEGPRGFQHLRDDLEERAELRSKGRVKRILFRTFVVE